MSSTVKNNWTHKKNSKETDNKNRHKKTCYHGIIKNQLLFKNDVYDAEINKSQDKKLQQKIIKTDITDLKKI